MFKYFGSKLRLAERYPAPRFDTIVEPFAGSAAYAVRHRREVDRVVLIEADKRIADLWDRLLKMSADDLMALPVPQQGQRSTEILIALAAGRTTRDTPESFIVSPRMAQRFTPMINRMASVIDECRHFEIVNGDFTVSPTSRPPGSSTRPTSRPLDAGTEHAAADICIPTRGSTTGTSVGGLAADVGRSSCANNPARHGCRGPTPSNTDPALTTSITKCGGPTTRSKHRHLIPA